MNIGKEATAYVKVLSHGEWSGDWAPVRARVEWLRGDGLVGLFTLIEPELDEDDEYEFYKAGTLVLGRPEDGEYKVKAGVEDA